MTGLPEPTLGVWIPTWNRSHFFERLMESLEPQVDDRVSVWAGVNPPSEHYKFPPWCNVQFNTRNIGQSRNILQGITFMDTDYLWILGDDEVVLPGALDTLRRYLSSWPGMVICQDGKFNVGPVGGFPDWVSWMDACIAEGCEYMLTAQTLMAVNVFRREPVRVDIAENLIDTRYGHHFGILAGLIGEPVVVTAEPVFQSGRAQDSSVWSEPQEYVSVHNQVTSQALTYLIEYAGELANRRYPSSCYQPGVGFDT